jgi:hypothetical protein
MSASRSNMEHEVADALARPIVSIAILDLARERDIILFNDAGVSSRSGAMPARYGVKPTKSLSATH